MSDFGKAWLCTLAAFVGLLFGSWIEMLLTGG